VCSFPRFNRANLQYSPKIDGVEFRPSVTRHLLILGLICFLTFFAGLGRGAIGDSDEAFYAEAAREMIESGDWITPYYNYELRFQKPILFYWLVAAAYQVAGVSEAAARAPSAFSGFLLAVLTYLAGRRWFDASTGFFAATIVATSFGYYSIGRQSLPDLLLALFIAAATWALIEALAAPTTTETLTPATRRLWLSLAAVLIGLGLLTKGPVAAVLPVWWRERYSASHGPTQTWRPGVLDGLLFGGIVVLVAAPWFIAMVDVHGVAYLHRFFVDENLERFATDRYNEPRPFWFYVPIVLGGLLPWSPFMLLWLPTWQRVLQRRRQVTRTEWRAVLWAAVPFVFYSLSIGKQPRYILPMLPPMALLMARSAIARLPDMQTRVPRQTALAWCGTLSAVILLLLGVLLHRARPLLFALSPSLGLVCTVIITVGAIAVFIASWTPRRWALPVTLTCASVATLLSLHYSVVSAADLEPVQRMARIYTTVHQGDEPSATYRVFVRNLIFYTGVQQVDLVEPEAVVAFMRQPERVLCVITRDDLDDIRRDHDIEVRTLGSVQYFNPAGVRLRTLLWPDPDEDLETVLLITNDLSDH
jgi:4-amino-4-deoxy-L-arabinose transferase-like glycosyltransferase